MTIKDSNKQRDKKIEALENDNKALNSKCT